ncbi:MAG TPA: hypothetical protein VKE71_14975 [Candidatus Angelobacter sp.]|nr:hypothetical protein [Candidatus Angelobacter sp.]
MTLRYLPSVCLCGFLLLCSSSKSSAQQFKFAVSGDSRNCGNVIMPAIAAGAAKDGATFYWHLGDLRAIYDFDQDIVDRRKKAGQPPLSIIDYERTAWDDFVQNQIGAFTIPFFLGIGNHETTAPKDRNQFLIQFADWLDSPVLRAQRLADDPKDHRLKAYFHWHQGPVDFIYLDNATPDQLDSEQMRWLEQVLARDSQDSAVKSVVVGMHEALPDSLAAGHSMSDFPVAERTGRQVYQDLLKLRDTAHKNVYVLASHSHFYMQGIFASDYLKEHGGVLPGWIVGTAGAVRYPLPPLANKAEAAKTNLYGYLLGTVAADGSIRFEFRQVKEQDIPASVAAQYTPEGLHYCLAENPAQP